MELFLENVAKPQNQIVALFMTFSLLLTENHSSIEFLKFLGYSHRCARILAQNDFLKFLKNEIEF
jgi:hypothetical protein